MLNTGRSTTTPMKLISPVLGATMSVPGARMSTPRCAADQGIWGGTNALTTSDGVAPSTGGVHTSDGISLSLRTAVALAVGAGLKKRRTTRVWTIKTTNDGGNLGSGGGIMAVLSCRILCTLPSGACRHSAGR